MRNKTAVKLYRQGDVMFKLVGDLPDGDRKKRDNGTVAYGEVTGHSHRLSVLESAEVLEIGDGLFVSVSEHGISLEGDNVATFVHEEHGAITLPAGNYQVVIQREYSPLAVTSVID